MRPAGSMLGSESVVALPQGNCGHADTVPASAAAMTAEERMLDD